MQTDDRPYWQRRREMKLGKPVAEVKKKQEMGSADWYALQLTQAPERCENCNKPLAGTANFIPKAVVCHILPKEHFKSVMWHLMNRWFGCGDCHSLYDDGPVEKTEKMPVIKVLRKRFRLFKNAIAPDEQRRIPKYLL